MTTAPNHNRPNPKENLMTSQLKQNLRFLTLAATLVLAFASLPTHAEFVLIDNFETYSEGDTYLDMTGWENSGTVDTDPAGGTNLVLDYNTSDGYSRYVGSDITIADNTTGTLFYRLRIADGDINCASGMSDTTDADSWGDYEAQLTWKSPEDTVDVRSGGGAAITPDAWYNIWMVIDNTNDEYDVYLQSNDDANFSSQTKIGSTAGFRNGAGNNDMVAFMLHSNNGDSIYIDDIKLDSTGQNLTIPEPASLTLLILGGLALTRRRQRG